LSDTMTTDEFLAHFGKKGMKWGVRKKAMTDSEIGEKAKRDLGGDLYKDYTPSGARGKNQGAASEKSSGHGKAKFARNLAVGVVVAGALGYAGGRVVRNLMTPGKHSEIDAAVKRALKSSKAADMSAARLGSMMSPENVKRLTKDGGVINFPARPPKAMYDSTAKLMGYR